MTRVTLRHKRVQIEKKLFSFPFVLKTDLFRTWFHLCSVVSCTELSTEFKKSFCSGSYVKVVYVINMFHTILYLILYIYITIYNHILVYSTKYTTTIYLFIITLPRREIRGHIFSWTIIFNPFLGGLKWCSREIWGLYFSPETLFLYQSIWYKNPSQIYKKGNYW